jgi:Ca2+-transporting ATPase
MEDSIELSAGSILNDSKSNPYAVYNGAPLDVNRTVCLIKLFEAGQLCNNSQVSGGVSLGMPTEGAILMAGIRLGISDKRATVKRLEEVPFSSETKMMEVRCSLSPGKEARFLKGATEVLLPRCSHYMNMDGASVPLHVVVRESVVQQAAIMSREGLRVLCVCSSHAASEITLLGLIGIKDPLRDGVTDAVHRIQSSGAKVIMITGDAEATAVSIAQQAGIYEKGSGRVISGKDIEDLFRSDQRLSRRLVVLTV